MSSELGANGVSQFERDGFQLIPKVLSPAECDALAKELSAIFDKKNASAKSRIGGVRNLLSTNENVRRLASSPKILALLQSQSDKTIFPVRAIFFDKTLETNWRIPWHQDLAIAVEHRIETKGFEGWSVKEGIPHVIPPSRILEGMVTVRIHLDPCDITNGALKVIPGSHAKGKMDAGQITEWTNSKVSVACIATIGDALFIKPLLLHASSPAENPNHRRVIHIEYASDDLPNGLKWFEHSTRQPKSGLAFIALGSNLGNSREILRNAIERLQAFSSTPLLKSSILKTAPADCPPGSPDFLNAVVALTPLSGETPESLLEKLQALEKEFGRTPKKILNEARPLDLDLISFGHEVRATPQLVLPHPRAHLRRFVLQPLVEIAPDFMLPGRTKNVRQLLAALPA